MGMDSRGQTSPCGLLWLRDAKTQTLGQEERDGRRGRENKARQGEARTHGWKTWDHARPRVRGSGQGKAISKTSVCAGYGPQAGTNQVETCNWSSHAIDQSL